LVALDLAEDDHRPEGVYDGGDVELRSPIRADDLKPGCLGLGVEAALGEGREDRGGSEHR